MSQNQSENPILKALPPETDYLSYLTILEYNINKEQLPTLHEILQDTTLTTNIGWDLVHLLLPLLPHSKLCMQDVARLGNPREVVLKVTELLEKIGSQDEEANLDESDEEAVDESQPVVGLQQNGDSKTEPPPREVQFCALLNMLQILVPRIRTKFPSRFLSTSLQATLPAYAKVAADHEATEAVVAFVKRLSGTSRPKLPPRASSTAVTIQKAETAQSAPDPEGNDGSVGSDEPTLYKRLLRAFLTFAVEAYMTALTSIEDVPGMAWSSRIQELRRPKSIVPGRRTFTELFDDQQGYLHNRDATVGQLTALSRDLGLLPPHLITILTTVSSPPSSPVDLPSTASEVPFSLPGTLYLLTASAVSSTLFNAPSNLPSIPRFPTYATIVNHLIGTSSPSSAGTEPLALIDATLALYDCLDAHLPGAPSLVGPFKETLQRLSLLSANTPNSALRYRAHELTKSVLYSYPDEEVRLEYIKDTLENCPYENLKGSAVGWLKDEIIAAGSPKSAVKDPIFATPAVLLKMTPYLFISPVSLAAGGDFTPFLAHQGFFLAVLNLMYLVLSSQTLNVNSWDLMKDLRNWLQQMESVASDIRVIANAGRKAGETSIEGLEMDLGLLEGNIAMVEQALGEIQAADKDQLGVLPA